MRSTRRRASAKQRRLYGALLGALALAITLLAVQGARPSSQPPHVRTVEGEVQGFLDKHTRQFLGIPYAAPPVGNLRWRPPQAVTPWTRTLDATRFAGYCPQQQRGVFAGPSVTEDCLYLNVFAPEEATPAEHPVMVWFHGGGLYSGESNDYDASKLARRGGVVVVTLNYRIGALGFLSHPAINNEGHPFANYGIMDQQAALKWVQRNIAAFGGDPGNITIFGQSGGGTSVMAQMQSPLARGLFHKVINQSGTHIAVTRPDTTLRASQQFAEAAGCADQSAACLRALSVEKVLAAQAPIVDYVYNFPTVDGQVITQTALEAFRSGSYNRTPILTGLVQDEQSFFMPELDTHEALTAEEYDAYTTESFGAANKEKLLQKYPSANYPSPTLAAIAMSQGSKACTARQLDQHWSKFAPVYAYQFEDRTAPSYFADVSFPMGAYHTAELQYLFPMFHGAQGTARPLNAEQEDLSNTMVDYWTSFARSGEPRSNNVRAPWSPYSAATDNIQVLDLAGIKQRDNYGSENNCALWDDVLWFQ